MGEVLAVFPGGYVVPGYPFNLPSQGRLSIPIGFLQEIKGGISCSDHHVEHLLVALRRIMPHVSHPCDVGEIPSSPALLAHISIKA
jgi:hypothetical protein